MRWTSSYEDRREVSELLGKTLTTVENVDNEQIIFTADTGEMYAMYHEQDCCEYVRIEDMDNSLDVLIGATILMEEAVSNENYKDQIQHWSDKIQDLESYTWTFYKLATIKGYVTIRWLGSSNGYYSEGVDFALIHPY